MSQEASHDTSGKVIAIGGMEINQLGNEADFLRGLYRSGAESIANEAKAMLRSGKSEEVVAKWVVTQRNNLKIEIRARGPELFRTVAEWRNRAKYGNALGPN